ncbi:MAG: hypothetical protein RPU15_08525 [Candidatus Sedimenticola sp. (ex Thyasira tokunagai)]
MATVDPAWIEMRYSGGGSNSDPLLSLGGAYSSASTQTQSMSGGMSGVALIDAVGNPIGGGTLAYTHNGGADRTLSWSANGEGALTTEIVDTDGRYTLRSDGGPLYGGLLVEVTAASLPTSDQNQTIAIGALTANILPDADKNQCYIGKDDYYCFYVHNASAVSLTDVRLYFEPNASGVDNLRLGFDPAGQGGTAQAIDTRYDIPVNVTFGTYDDIDSALVISSFPAGAFQPIWIERQIPARVPATYNSDTASLIVLQY